MPFRLPSVDAKRIVCLRAGKLSDQRPATRASDILPLLAVSKAFWFQLRYDGRNQGDRSHYRHGTAAHIELAIQSRGAALLRELLRITDLQTRRGRPVDVGYPAWHSR